MRRIKYRNDPWLTDYINAIHFALRFIETQSEDRDALYHLQQETDWLIQEAILGSIPLEIFTIRQLADRIRSAEHHLSSRDLIDREIADNPPLRLSSFPGNAQRLMEDFHFICMGLSEFSLDAAVEECKRYLPKIYPDLPKLGPVILEILELDKAAGVVLETEPGVFRYRSVDHQD